MRWDRQGISVDDGALPGLQRIGFVRSVRSPQFEGMTFHEILCKSALNKVPEASMLPFRFTVNGYRGCSHACRYCVRAGCSGVGSPSPSSMTAYTSSR